MIHLITKLFPVWAILLSVIAYFSPNTFSELKSAIIPLLTVIMFGMGMTLTWSNFRKVIKSPGVIFIGVLLQYLVMPLSAFIISKLLDLPTSYMAGMILVGTSAGGTASNVICYLARGNVALSITLTMTSTLIAIFATPSLTYLYLNQIISVPFWNMLLSILQIVIFPVLLGTTINTFLRKHINKIRPVFPLISTMAIVIIIAIIVGLNQPRLQEVGFILIFAVMLHNLCGLLIGYWLPKSIGYNDQICRTLSIEVGMQNSGLSVALAVKYFSIIAAIPGAIFSIWHNLSGSILAGYWSSRNPYIPEKS
jgi:BASS family bile acid:Na+ symporter